MKIIFMVLMLALSITAATASPGAQPTRYLIQGVPQFSQITGLHCGPAALESIFAYHGVDIDQRQIANVARTSSMGTYVFDMVRAGHFSRTSAAQGHFYPNDVPVSGYRQRALGYAAFGRAQTTPWLNELKALVAQDIPVVLLMLFSPDPSSGGHYRVLVGYDDDLGEAYFIDPWGRDLGRVTNADGTVTWTYQDLLTAWNYAEYGTSQPYFGAALLPWRVALTTQGAVAAGKQITLTANVEYPCPAPFNCSASPAATTTVELALPPGMRLVNSSSGVAVGTLVAGGKTTARWKVAIDYVQPGAALEVTAAGTVSGAMPEAWWAGEQVYYPPYTYSDLIGGKARLDF